MASRYQGGFARPAGRHASRGRDARVTQHLRLAPVLHSWQAVQSALIPTQTQIRRFLSRLAFPERLALVKPLACTSRSGDATLAPGTGVAFVTGVSSRRASR